MLVPNGECETDAQSASSFPTNKGKQNRNGNRVDRIVSSNNNRDNSGEID